MSKNQTLGPVQRMQPDCWQTLLPFLENRYVSNQHQRERPVRTKLDEGQRTFAE
jgi:hypothetical protein